MKESGLCAVAVNTAYSPERQGLTKVVSKSSISVIMPKSAANFSLNDVFSVFEVAVAVTV